MRGTPSARTSLKIALQLSRLGRIYTPSPLRMLRLCSARLCEKCRKVRCNTVNEFGLNHCAKCTKKSTATARYGLSSEARNWLVITSHRICSQLRSRRWMMENFYLESDHFDMTPTLPHSETQGVVRNAEGRERVGAILTIEQLKRIDAELNLETIEYNRLKREAEKAADATTTSSSSSSSMKISTSTTAAAAAASSSAAPAFSSFTNAVDALTPPKSFVKRVDEFLESKTLPRDVREKKFGEPSTSLFYEVESTRKQVDREREAKREVSKTAGIEKADSVLQSVLSSMRDTDRLHYIENHVAFECLVKQEIRNAPSKYKTKAAVKGLLDRLDVYDKNLEAIHQLRWIATEERDEAVPYNAKNDVPSTGVKSALAASFIAEHALTCYRIALWSNTHFHQYSWFTFIYTGEAFRELCLWKEVESYESLQRLLHVAVLQVMECNAEAKAAATELRDTGVDLALLVDAYVESCVILAKDNMRYRWGGFNASLATAKKELGNAYDFHLSARSSAHAAKKFIDAFKVFETTFNSYATEKFIFLLNELVAVRGKAAEEAGVCDEALAAYLRRYVPYKTHVEFVPPMFKARIQLYPGGPMRLIDAVANRNHPYYQKKSMYNADTALAKHQHIRATLSSMGNNENQGVGGVLLREVFVQYIRDEAAMLKQSIRNLEWMDRFISTSSVAPNLADYLSYARPYQYNHSYGYNGHHIGNSNELGYAWKEAKPIGIVYDYEPSDKEPQPYVISHWRSSAPDHELTYLDRAVISLHARGWVPFFKEVPVPDAAFYHNRVQYTLKSSAVGNILANLPRRGVYMAAAMSSFGTVLFDEAVKTALPELPYVSTHARNATHVLDEEHMRIFLLGLSFDASSSDYYPHDLPNSTTQTQLLGHERKFNEKVKTTVELFVNWLRFINMSHDDLMGFKAKQEYEDAEKEAKKKEFEELNRLRALASANSSSSSSFSSSATNNVPMTTTATTAAAGNDDEDDDDDDDDDDDNDEQMQSFADEVVEHKTYGTFVPSHRAHFRLLEKERYWRLALLIDSTQPNDFKFGELVRSDELDDYMTIMHAHVVEEYFRAAWQEISRL